MKHVSFMVALLAAIQLLMSSRLSQAQNFKLKQDPRSDRRTFEEALDTAGHDIGQELEELFEQLDIDSQKIGQRIERWAQENSDELSAWSQKYGDQWEAFGEQLESTIESIAEDQNDVWSRWAERYERDLELLSDELEQEQLTGENIGKFVDRNLAALSKMPLGDLVDQVLEKGVGELRSAPWESLEELGLIAKDALQEPLEEFSELTIDGAKARRALKRNAREMRRILDRLKDDIGRNISDSDLLELSDEEAQHDSENFDSETYERAYETDRRIMRLEDLLRRDGVTEQQRQAIQDMIEAIRNSGEEDQTNKRPRYNGDASSGRTIDLPRRDQILKKIERENKRHAQALEEFNQDLQRSAESSLENLRQKSDLQWRKKDQRKPKAWGEKPFDSQSRSGKADQFKYFRDGDGRQPRSQKRSRDSNRKSSQAESGPAQVDDLSSDEDEDEMETIQDLLRQIEELCDEVESLTRDRS